jgi:hypothetical protein
VLDVFLVLGAVLESLLSFTIEEFKGLFVVFAFLSQMGNNFLHL